MRKGNMHGWFDSEGLARAAEAIKSHELQEDAACRV